MYRRGQIWLRKNHIVLIDTVWCYLAQKEERITGKVRRIKEGDEIELGTTPINFIKEKDNLTFIGEIKDADYTRLITAAWHKEIPHTWPYEVCEMKKATHVVFTEMDLSLAGEDGEGFTPWKLYPIGLEGDSGDFYIVDDQENIVVGFEMFIPCEFLKKKLENVDEQNHRVLEEDNVIQLAEYIKKKNDQIE